MTETKRFNATAVMTGLLGTCLGVIGSFGYVAVEGSPFAHQAPVAGASASTTPDPSLSPSGTATPDPSPSSSDTPSSIDSPSASTTPSADASPSGTGQTVKTKDGTTWEVDGSAGTWMQGFKCQSITEKTSPGIGDLRECKTPKYTVEVLDGVSHPSLSKDWAAHEKKKKGKAVKAFNMTTFIIAEHKEDLDALGEVAPDYAGPGDEI